MAFIKTIKASIDEIITDDDICCCKQCGNDLDLKTASKEIVCSSCGKTYDRGELYKTTNKTLH